MPSSPDPDQVRRLYSTPPRDFVSERDELAKRLREEGDREAAATVRKLTKPSMPAWAVNRAAEEDPEGARRLLESGRRLAAAGDGNELRDAMADHGAAIEAMMGAVEEGLRSVGSDRPGFLDRARDTLRALATDDALREEFERGAVVKDREAVGFGSATLTSASAKPRRQDASARKRRGEQRERVAAARKALTAATKETDRARAELGRVRQRLAGAERRLKQAEQERSRRERDLEAAEEGASG